MSDLYKAILFPHHSVQHVPTLERVLRSAVAAPTWAARRRTLSLLKSPTAAPIAALEEFFATRLKRVAATTVVKDIAHLKWIFPRLGMDHVIPLLEDLSKGIRKQAASAPTTKALPLSRRALSRLLYTLPPNLKCLAMLCFRTASRVSDVASLSRNDIVINRHDILIQFRTTKANQFGIRRADHKVLLSMPETEIVNFFARRPPSHKPIWTKQDFASLRKALSRLKPDPVELKHWVSQSPDEKVRTRYTFHSFKRGAAALLWEAAAEGTIEVVDLLLLLKHKDIESSLQYCPVPTLAAKAVGSKATHVTRLSLNGTARALHI